MDQSRPYQTMCTMAVEIQARWIPAKGDVYLTPQQGNHPCFWSGPEGEDTFRKGFAIRREGNIIFLEARIWLPRLNQLMDLAQIPGIRFQDMTFRFHTWAGKPGEREKDPVMQQYKSLEQLWLAFIMASHFSRQWDGTRWVLIPPVTA
ncbi:hypothetical protein LZ24_03160 [Desulfobotulus alkaliphilus]|uniref:Uncharacterized protein n=1 Tax=Desulfobotulus alkaliphilus TaxID=622671 RepID=A0A562R6H9_9BACT|nr:hypothetical protein [Desulfobotulus alkaliphilus]TWI64174.1 hypothetical protein LZ24_03160 [Desulfobotulus alkaliphilus]